MCVCAPACFIWVFVWVWGFNEALLTQHISWGNGRLRGKAARVFHEQAAKRLPQFHPCNVTTKRADISLLCQSYSRNPSFIGLTDACEIISPAPLPAHMHARTFAHDLSKFDWRAQPSVAGCIVDISRGQINALPVWLHNCVFMLLWRRRPEPEPEASCVSLNAIAQ